MEKKRKNRMVWALPLLLLVILPGFGVRWYLVRTAQKPQTELETGMWYTLRAEGCITAEGESFETRMRVGSENKLIVLFYGGGLSTDEYTAAHPYVGLWSDRQTGFYDTDLSGQIPDIYQLGIADRSEANSFRDWSVIVIPYTTGDLHIGDADYVYTDENGEEQVLHHHGYQNYRAIMDAALAYIGTEPEELLIAGFSAGGFAAALLTDELMTEYFPEAGHVTVCVDSSLLLLDNWQEIASELWQAPEQLVQKFRSDDPVADCFAELYDRYGESVTLLCIGSTRDGALSQYQAYYDTGVFMPDNDNLPVYEANLSRRITRLRNEVPSVGIFLFDSLPYSWSPALSRLTQHTVLCTRSFSRALTDGISPLAWMENAIAGRVTSVGLNKVTA